MALTPEEEMNLRMLISMMRSREQEKPQQQIFEPPPQQSDPSYQTGVQPQQQQGGGMSPTSAYSAYSSFAPSTTAVGTGVYTTAGTGAGTTASTVGGMQSALGGGAAATGGGTAAGGGASGGAGMMGAAGPWAALAAVIAANETYQNKSGNRPKDFDEQVKEGFTGESVGRDVERYFGNGPVADFFGNAGNPEGVGNMLKKGGKNAKKLLPWEWF
jgi:hypothetical protein